MRYKDLIFDLYGTLVDIHTEENESAWEECAAYLCSHGIHCTGRELCCDFLSLMERREMEAGKSYECFPEIAFDSVLSEILTMRGASSGIDSLSVQAALVFRISSTEYIKLYKGVRAALARLRRSGHRLWLLSNAQSVFTSYELKRLGIDEAFDGIYLSSDYGCRKPDNRFYRILLESEGLSPEDCLMIGNDRETDIKGAAGLGIATLFMHTNLTPRDQSAADDRRHPRSKSIRCRSYEYEGCDWEELVELIEEVSG